MCVPARPLMCIRWSGTRTDPAIVLAVAPGALALSNDGGWSWREMSWEDSQGHSQNDVVWQGATCDDEGQWWIIGRENTGASVVWRAGAERARRIDDIPQRDAKLSAVACAGATCVLGWDDGALWLSHDRGESLAANRDRRRAAEWRASDDFDG